MKTLVCQFKVSAFSKNKYDKQLQKDACPFSSTDSVLLEGTSP